MNTNKTNKFGPLLALVASVFLVTSAWSGDEEDMAFEGKRAYLGVYVESVPTIVSSQLNLDEGVGVVVQKLVESGPAEEAGLKKHDILLKFDDQILIGTKQVVILVRNSEIGSEHEITYVRGGKEMTTTVTLGETEYKKKKQVDEQSFYHFPNAPAAPVAPDPSRVHELSMMEEHVMAAEERSVMVQEQRRAIEALARAQEQLAHAVEVETIRVTDSEDFTRTMEISEEIEVLMDRVNRAAQGSQNLNMPTIVFAGTERVFEFSDAEGQRFMIVENDGEKQLTVIGPGGEETFNGPLNEDALALLPENLKKKLPEIHKIVQIKTPMRAPVQERGIETF